MGALDNTDGAGSERDSSLATLDAQLGRNVPQGRSRGRQAPAVIIPEVTPALIRDRYLRGYQALRSDTYEFGMNCAFLLGQQWLWFNPHTNRVENQVRDPDRVQAVMNRLWPASRSIVAKLVSRELVFEVSPSAADDSTQRAAKLGEAILEHSHDHHDWESLREEAIWSTWKGGTTAICVEWDPDAGQDIDADPETGRKVSIGDTTESVLTIAEFVVEPGSRIAEKARWWIKANAFPPEQVQAKYRMNKKPAADASAAGTPLSNKLLTDKEDVTTPLTLVLTMFERPNFLSPQGTICTIVGDTIVDGPHDWYFPWKEHLNFALMRETPVNGRWSGATVLTVARPVQVALNASWSSIIEHVKLAGNARLAVSTMDVENYDVFTDLPGEIVQFLDPLAKPSYITPPSMPNWWIEQPVALAKELDDILGQHDVSRGAAPQNIESGYGLTILAEEDATPLGRLTKEQALAWGKVGTMVLELLADRASEPRTAKVLTPGMPPATMLWTAKDLKKQTHAKVPLDAVVPRSRAAMQAFAEKAMQMGLITTPAQFAQLADAPNQREMIEITNIDVAKARRENAIMASGEYAFPADYDDHQTHVAEHNNYRKSVDYDLLDDKKVGPDGLTKKQVFEYHIQGHAVMSAEELGEQFNKGMHNPLLAAAVSAKGAPTIAPGDASILQSQNGPGGEGAPGATGASADGLPAPATPSGTSQPAGLSTPLSAGPAMGPPSNAFPQGTPQPPAGGGH